jgi:hypothetical protein
MRGLSVSRMPQLPEYRVIFNPPPRFRAFGCAGCLIAIFVVGGIVGVLLFGWKTLLGL